MWTSGSKVKYISHSGHESIKIITVTDEGFISVIDGNNEFLFSSSGIPINTFTNSETGGPAIKRITNDREQPSNNNEVPNYKKATFNQPWDNLFAIKNLTIKELHALTVELIKLGHGDEKLHLKNFNDSANAEQKMKIKQIFMNASNNTCNRKNKNKNTNQ